MKTKTEVPNGHRIADEYSPDAERDPSKSIKEVLLMDPGRFLPLSTPRGVLDELESWIVVSKSPYSYSLYDITNKGWGPDPEPHLRIADHWNYTAGDPDIVHGVTNLTIPRGHWGFARKKDGIYEVLKVWEKTPDVSGIRNAARRAGMEKLTPARSALLLALEKGPIQLTARQKGTFESWWAKGGWNFVTSRVCNQVGLNEIGSAVVRDGKIDLSRAKDATEGLEDFPNARELSLASLDKNSRPFREQGCD